jgi:hypothetical protein
MARPKKTPELAVDNAPATEGHNSTGLINEPLLQIFTDWEALELQKKEITKAQNQLKAKAKTEHNIPKMNFAQEIRLRKMDSEVRAHFEATQKDLQVAIGYQMALDIAIPKAEEVPAEGKSYKKESPEEAAERLAAE